MIALDGEVATPIADAMLARLCKHFSKKIPASWEAGEGHARFPFGECRLRAAANALRFECSAPDPEALAQLRMVIELHVAMFSRRAPLTVRWRGSEGGGTVPT